MSDKEKSLSPSRTLHHDTGHSSQVTQLLGTAGDDVIKNTGSVLCHVEHDSVGSDVSLFDELMRASDNSKPDESAVTRQLTNTHISSENQIVLSSKMNPAESCDVMPAACDQSLDLNQTKNTIKTYDISSTQSVTFVHSVEPPDNGVAAEDSDQTIAKRRLPSDTTDSADVTNTTAITADVQTTINKPVKSAVAIHASGDNVALPEIGATRITRQQHGPSRAPAIKGTPVSSPARRKEYSYEEILESLQRKIHKLLNLDNFLTPEVRVDLKFIRRTTRYSSDVLLNKRIVDNLVHYGVVHVFLRVWKSVSSVDFMDYTRHETAYKNLQVALSIVWNCSDKSTPLCESLVKTGVVNTLLAELGGERLSGSDLANDNNLYLVKSYLGILHNVARLCSDSRHILHSANAVGILQWYLQSSNDLVKTNAFMVLSYVISDEENDVINANNDNIAFVVSVLQDALASENHFSKKYGFWALEVVAGLNHLAVNDDNKARYRYYVIMVIELSTFISSSGLTSFNVIYC